MAEEACQWRCICVFDTQYNALNVLADANEKKQKKMFCCERENFGIFIPDASISNVSFQMEPRTGIPRNSLCARYFYLLMIWYDIQHKYIKTIRPEFSLVCSQMYRIIHIRFVCVSVSLSLFAMVSWLKKISHHEQITRAITFITCLISSGVAFISKERRRRGREKKQIEQNGDRNATGYSPVGVFDQSSWLVIISY